jgi:hypothetical protein
MLGHEARRPLAVTRSVRAGALALVLFGCESHIMAFQPVNASQVAGFKQPTVRYDLRVGSSVLGSATLWSEGASEEEVGPRFFDIGLAIHNTTKSPIRLDIERSQVTASTHERRREPLDSAATRSGSETIAPYSTGRVGLRFALPRGLVATDVEQFEFAWRLESPEGEYKQSTRFAAVGATPLDAEGRTITCVGAYGFNTSEDCKDANTQINR